MSSASRGLVSGFLLLLLTFSCQPPESPRYYLAVAHTRQCDGQPPDYPDPRLAELRPDTFRMRWLAGDLACATSKRSETLQHLDSLVDFRDPHTLLAIGNHDVSRPEALNEFTARPTYYTTTQDGIVFLVLDTQRDQCRITGPQLELFRTLTDTLQESRSLVLLHHKLIWLPGHPELEKRIGEVSNIGLCEGPYCLYRNNFYDDLYPRLRELSERGVQVLCIGGDIGIRRKTFSYELAPDFHLLATGWNDVDPADRYLRLEKRADSSALRWAFLPLPR